MKFRLSRNSTKFDVVARFRETSPFRHSRSRKISDLTDITILPFFRKLDFLGVSHSPLLKRISSRNSTHICIQPCAYVTLQSLIGVQTLTFPGSQSLTTQWVVYLIHVMNDVHIPCPCRLTNTQCNFQWVSKSRVTPNSYHSTLSLRDNHDRVFSLGQ